MNIFIDPIEQVPSDDKSGIKNKLVSVASLNLRQKHYFLKSIVNFN